MTACAGHGVYACCLCQDASAACMAALRTMICIADILSRRPCQTQESWSSVQRRVIEQAAGTPACRAISCHRISQSRATKCSTTTASRPARTAGAARPSASFSRARTYSTCVALLRSTCGMQDAARETSCDGAVGTRIRICTAAPDWHCKHTVQESSNQHILYNALLQADRRPAHSNYHCLYNAPIITQSNDSRIGIKNRLS